jgi:hypothetical protein
MGPKGVTEKMKKDVVNKSMLAAATILVAASTPHPECQSHSGSSPDNGANHPQYRDQRGVGGFRQGGQQGVPFHDLGGGCLTGFQLEEPRLERKLEKVGTKEKHSVTAQHGEP